MKRVQFQRWGKRISSSFTGSSSSSSSSAAAAAAVAIVVGRKRKGGPLGWCCSRSYVPKKWVNKFKAQWKKAIGWRKSSCPPQYSYDIQSYSLNFDDGGCR
ncbi:hypothetical protein LINGRAHAP2_LOCUS15191 [Linum grandiflorum]